MRTGNPTLSDRVFAGQIQNAASGEVMTLDGTVNKTFFLTALTAASAYWAWNDPKLIGMAMPAALAGLILALIIAFKPTSAPLLAPVYAIAQGFLLGAVSVVTNARYPGIVMQAVGLTFGTLFCLLFAYRSGLIKATENFKLGVFSATAAIALMYVLSLVLGLFGVSLGLESTSPLSIGISLFVVVIAALNLVLDFDFIEKASLSRNVPKYMEWYGAFGLLVTLVWLYLEILRLLSKLSSRR